MSTVSGSVPRGKLANALRLLENARCVLDRGSKYHPGFIQSVDVFVSYSHTRKRNFSHFSHAMIEVMSGND
jgi:hypothetical protein